MTGSKHPGRKSMENLSRFLAEDIMSASDEDLLAEFTECGGDANAEAERLRALFEASIVKANKSRLAAARAGAAASRSSPRLSTACSPQDARQRLRSVLGRPGIPQRLTLAARKENELSDADVLGMLDDLRDLGLLRDEDDLA